MLLIECPWCGARAESEFTYGGEAGIARPRDADKLSDKQWGDYLFMRNNTRGLHREQWCHSQGCRRWFVAARDTVSYAFHAVKPPRTEAAEAPQAPHAQNGERSA